MQNQRASDVKWKDEKGKGSHPEYARCYRSTSKGGLLEACPGNGEVMGEMFPERQAGPDRESFIRT